MCVCKWWIPCKIYMFATVSLANANIALAVKLLFYCRLKNFIFEMNSVHSIVSFLLNDGDRMFSGILNTCRKMSAIRNI